MASYLLTHWGRVTHICVSEFTIIGSDNGLTPCRRQAIIWTNVGILLIRPLGTNFSENLIEIHAFSFKKIDLKMSSGKWRSFCLGLNVLSAWLLSLSEAVMVYCLLDPSKNIQWNASILIPENEFETVVCTMATILSRPQCVDLTAFILLRDFLCHFAWSHLVNKHYSK